MQYLPKPFWSGDAAIVILWLNQAIRDGEQADVSSERFKSEITSQLSARGRDAYLPLLTLETLQRLCRRHRATCLCTAAGLAAERYRIQHQRWPKTREEWNSVIDVTLLLDPFNGEPLQMKVVPHGLVISCSPVNPIDKDDLPSTSSNRTGKDTSFPLWNVEQRGIVPKP